MFLFFIGSRCERYSLRKRQKTTERKNGEEDKCNDGKMYFYILVFIIIHPVSCIGKILCQWLLMVVWRFPSSSQRLLSLFTIKNPVFNVEDIFVEFNKKNLCGDSYENCSTRDHLNVWTRTRTSNYVFNIILTLIKTLSSSLLNDFVAYGLKVFN